MKPGDLVVMPLKKKPAVAIGEVQGDYQFDRKAEGPFRHSRKVKWIKTILRTNLDRDLLYSFGAFMTFCQIERNNAEERESAQGRSARHCAWYPAIPGTAPEISGGVCVRVF
jgi:restriction system protein